MNPPTAFTLVALAFAGTAHAANIVYSFNDNTGVATTNELSGDGVTAGTASIASNGGNTASIANNRAQRDLGTSGLNETSTFQFTLSIGATPVSLTSISFVNGLDVNAGSVVTNFWEWDLAIDVLGSGASQTTFARDHNNGGASPDEVSFNESATLSGLTNLSNVDVTFTFTGEYGTSANYTGGTNSNRFIYLDDMTVTAEVIPEPSSLLLGAFGGLALLGRRRRA